MTASDNSGEASMDEILASIRKIIADDPNQSRAPVPDRRAVNPLTEPAPARPGMFDRDARPLPPADRLAEAIRSNAAAPRPAQTAPASYAPPARQRPMLDHGLDDLIDDGPRGGLNLNAPPAPAPTPPVAETTIDDAASGTWASWRSFKSAPAAAPVAAPVSAPTPAVFETSKPDPVAAAAAAAAAHEPEPSPGFKALTEETLEEAEVKRDPFMSAPPAPVAPPAAPQPYQTKSFAAAFPRPSVEGTLAPAARATHNGHGLTNGTPLAADTPTAQAANAALEKLAVGLAELPPVAAIQASAPVEAPQQPVQSSPPPPPASAAPTATGRSLEDTVTDMLRPMLEKWIETNMPRLMEKALRGDLSNKPKS